MFYGAIVVPVGTKVLQSDRQQGFITRSVTNYMNGAGVVCLTVWGWELIADPKVAWRRLRWALLILMIVALGLLGWLHFRLDMLLDKEHSQILDLSRFHFLHQWYLIISTLQWACSILLLAMTLNSWQSKWT